MVLALTLVGLALQLAGAAVTGWGARLIWRQAATGGERLLDPAVDTASQSWQRLTDPVLRWIGRPRSRSVQIGTATSIETAGSIRPMKSYRPLATDLSIPDAIAELDHRTQAIIAEVSRVNSQLLDGLDDQGRRYDDLSQVFDRYVAEQGEHARQRDRRGIRFEAAGLALVTIGAIAQALGQAAAS